MTTVDEHSKSAVEENAVRELEQKIADAKPTLDMFQHLAATQAISVGFTVRLVDGTSHKATSGDFFFTDGISVVENEHRIYIPKTSIKSILIHNPGE